MLRRTSTAVVALFLAAASAVFADKRAGVVVIRDEPDYWGFVYPELLTMKADVVKFHLSYDNQWAPERPRHFAVPAIHVRGAIWAGARDIIFRTAETRISRADIEHLLQNMTFWDTGESLADFIYNRRHEVHCWIEVGNEPDLAGADPWVHRWHLLDVAKNVIPRWRWLWTMHWLASAPAGLGDPANVFYAVTGEGSVQSAYDGIGTHEYGDYGLSMSVTSFALRRLPADKGVWITEAGINHSYDWTTKGALYRRAIQNHAADPRIRGWTFFLLSKEAYWNTCPNPDGTCMRYGIDLYYNSAVPVPGRPCAVQISRR